MNSNFRIAIDFAQLDSLSPASGQYRYAIDLVRALGEMRPDVNFLLLGSRSEPVSELHCVFQKYGDRWKYRQLPRWQFRGSDYLNHLRYSLMLLRERISLLHSLHTFVPWLAHCPVVITIYDLMYELFDEYEEARSSRPYRLNRWAVKHLVRRVLCISETTAADLRQRWGIEESRIDVVPLGSNFGRAKPASPLESKLPEPIDSAPLLVSPFNLERRKNLDSLLKAIALLTSSRPELKLVLFGHAAVTSEREEDFERQVTELGLGKNVIRTGLLTDSELVALYRRATLFVFPSLYEGFGLPVLEAMSVGACVVTRNASAMVEVVGEAGMLVETSDPDALASSIANLLDDESLRTSLGHLARKRAALFNVERMANLTYRSYLAALKPSVKDSVVYVNS